MKIKVREITKGCKFEFIEKGEWIDLRAAEDLHLNSPQASTLKRKTINGVEESHRDVIFDSKLLKLGIAMQIPEGYEAVILPRSGTYGSFGIMCRNSEGVIDHSYSGNNDEWRFTPIAFKECDIKKGDRVCQFRIQLSQKATVWQKIKWLFSSKIKFEWVDDLGGEDRGGFGSTGVK